jgi:hypothetical protein
MCIIVWIAVVLPWEIAFPEDSIPELNSVILAFFILDIAVNARTTYFNDEFEEIVDPK